MNKTDKPPVHGSAIPLERAGQGRKPHGVVSIRSAMPRSDVDEVEVAVQRCLSEEGKF